MLYSLTALLLCVNMSAAMRWIPGIPSMPPPGGRLIFPRFPWWPKAGDYFDFDCHRACYSTVTDWLDALSSTTVSYNELLSSCEEEMLKYRVVPKDFCLNLIEKATRNLEFRNNVWRSSKVPNKSLLLDRIFGNFCGRICYADGLTAEDF
ncbi:hypothetical protein OESDEN_12379 [Oesophagostomum dentatum]|uniref:Uncharacterized protein n=1 Tax=Oesophagostomum dentatum TaxID=61180 RepID=A0A0B1SWD4_OESDE|nr:hypothetical protein OESDEN_12379 [Oesophagostomum dentatum]